MNRPAHHDPLMALRHDFPHVGFLVRERGDWVAVIGRTVTIHANDPDEMRAKLLAAIDRTPGRGPAPA
jgi:hypothetical protein